MYGLGMDLFEKFNVVYIDQPYNTFVDLKTLEIDYNYFKQYTNRLIVLDFSLENHTTFEHHVYEQLSKTDINFLLLTYNYAQHQQYPRMLYFPYYSQWLINSTNKRVPLTTVSKSYSLGCLNGNPRPHRIANFLKLRKKPYWDKTSMTFFYRDDGAKRSDDLRLTVDEINEWNEIKKSLPAPVLNITQLDLPQLTNSYLHLVVETTVASHSISTTEKTWKPIAAGVPFVMLSNPGTMDFLKQHGVDIYDDIIDHKYYDSEQSARARLDKLHTVIDDLMLQGIDKIYNQLTDRVITNQTKFFNGEFDLHYLETLTNTIKQYQ